MEDILIIYTDVNGTVEIESSKLKGNVVHTKRGPYEFNEEATWELSSNGKITKCLIFKEVSK